MDCLIAELHKRLSASYSILFYSILFYSSWTVKLVSWQNLSHYVLMVDDGTSRSLIPFEPELSLLTSLFSLLI